VKALSKHVRSDGEMREEKAIQKVKNRDPDRLQALMDRYIPYVS
jgi:hypothetical protein